MVGCYIWAGVGKRGEKSHKHWSAKTWKKMMWAFFHFILNKWATACDVPQETRIGLQAKIDEEAPLGCGGFLLMTCFGFDDRANKGCSDRSPLPPDLYLDN